MRMQVVIEGCRQLHRFEFLSGVAGCDIRRGLDCSNSIIRSIHIYLVFFGKVFMAAWYKLLTLELVMISMWCLVIQD